MKRIKSTKPLKFLILITTLLIGGYLLTSMKESFTEFDISKIKNQNYCTKKQDRFLFFMDDGYGQYIQEGAPILFNYTLNDGKVILQDLENQEVFMTLYNVKSGLYSRSNRLYFYPY